MPGEYPGMIHRLLQMAFEGLAEKQKGSGRQTASVVAIVCLAAVVGLIVFRITCPEAARAALQALWFIRRIR
jgi:hypothetical protein